MFVYLWSRRPHKLIINNSGLNGNSEIFLRDIPQKAAHFSQFFCLQKAFKAISNKTGRTSNNFWDRDSRAVIIRANISPVPTFLGRWNVQFGQKWANIMFAHPLDLIMIYEDNICSNVPTVSFIFNQCEWIRNGPPTSRPRTGLPRLNLLMMTSLGEKIIFAFIWSGDGPGPQNKKRLSIQFFPLRANLMDRLGNNLVQIKTYFTGGRSNYRLNDVSSGRCLRWWITIKTSTPSPPSPPPSTTSLTEWSPPLPCCN